MMGLLFSHEYWRCPALSHKCPQHYKPLSTSFQQNTLNPHNLKCVSNPMQTISKFISTAEPPCMVVSYTQCYRQREPRQGKDMVFISVQWIKPASWTTVADWLYSSPYLWDWVHLLWLQIIFLCKEGNILSYHTVTMIPHQGSHESYSQNTRDRLKNTWNGFNEKLGIERLA